MDDGWDQQNEEGAKEEKREREHRKDREKAEQAREARGAKEALYGQVYDDVFGDTPKALSSPIFLVFQSLTSRANRPALLKFLELDKAKR